MILYIVATPIGNLEDFSPRAERVLREVDIILCEDTRVTKKLLNRFKIEKPLLSFHAQSNEKRMQEIVDALRAGKNCALVSDAGTPGINDPGGKLVERVVRVLGDDIKIIPIPGPSAVATALSAAGFPSERFHYMGFPPNKKGREKFFTQVATTKETIVFLESPHRILKALEQMERSIPEREIVVMRELTKLFETMYRGTPKKVTERIKNDTIKGEFVVVVGPIKK